MKGGNSASNALKNQRLRRLEFSMWRSCLAVFAVYSFGTNSLLIFDEKKPQKHLMSTRNPVFRHSLRIQLKVCFFYDES